MKQIAVQQARHVPMDHYKNSKYTPGAYEVDSSAAEVDASSSLVGCCTGPPLLLRFPASVSPLRGLPSYEVDSSAAGVGASPSLAGCCTGPPLLLRFPASVSPLGGLPCALFGKRGACLVLVSISIL